MLKLSKKVNVSGLEFSLLINLVWEYSKDGSSFISNLYEDLFNETFDEVCEKLFSITKKVLFTDIAPFILHQLNADLIYSEEENNSHAIINKNKSVLSIIKSINEAYPRSKSDMLETFIKYGSSYILQKSVLKEYDYYPDFVIVRHGGELTLVKYNIKKTHSKNDVPIYKLSFKHENLPFELTGIIRDRFLVGNISLEENKVEEYSEEIDSFEDLLQSKENISSDVKINSKSNEVLELGMYKKGLNKLISWNKWKENYWLMKQIILDVLDHKILRRKNKIMLKSLETKFTEDRIIKMLSKELTKLVVKLQNIKKGL